MYVLHLFPIPTYYMAMDFANSNPQGSYSPNTTDKPEYEKKCTATSSPLQSSPSLNIQLTIPIPVEPDTAPNGMLGRGHYEAVSKFIDDDNQTHLQFKWAFDVKKDW